MVFELTFTSLHLHVPEEVSDYFNKNRIIMGIMIMLVWLLNYRWPKSMIIDTINNNSA